MHAVNFIYRKKEYFLTLLLIARNAKSQLKRFEFRARPSSKKTRTAKDPRENMYI